ncbi:hypothetical protein [Noviherbaspirillum pedocola]|uniref:Uncharacterized protein n=1 Tax=Noviherbaspirillum pedocola TaxID=2801341 RepID=A0A934W6N5_9BURK|nr:hypothetical protein [Noviherbaspirillum pedocola]MBK4735340.1 hypothetical protein [Noviherbaspirillum pedocola]
MFLKGIRISVASSLAYALGLSKMLIRGTTGPNCTQQLVGQHADVSSREAQQQVMSGKVKLPNRDRQSDSAKAFNLS